MVTYLGRCAEDQGQFLTSNLPGVVAGYIGSIVDNEADNVPSDLGNLDVWLDEAVPGKIVSWEVAGGC